MIGSSVSFYQTQGCNSIPNQVVFSGTTDNDGKFNLPNRQAVSVTTATGHALANNPFGTINIVGCNGIFLMKIVNGLKTDYQWLDIASFNLAYWKGNTQNAIYEIKTNIKNLALNKSATAITSNGEAIASRAVDGDKTSTDKGYWAPFNFEGKVGDWWKVDLGQVYPIFQVNVYSSAANGHDWFQRFHIEVSQTGAFAGEQQTVATETDWDAVRNWTNKATYRFNSVSARYVRIVADSAFNFTRLQEVEVYEADVPNATLGVNTKRDPSLFDRLFQSIYRSLGVH